MSVLKDRFSLRGNNTKYPGRTNVINSLMEKKHYQLEFARDKHGDIIGLDPTTRKPVGKVPRVVCPERPDLEDKYDLLECFVDLQLAKPVAIKTRHGNIIIEVTVST